MAGPDTHNFKLPESAGGVYGDDADSRYAPGATALKEAESGAGNHKLTDADGNTVGGKEGKSASGLRNDEESSGKAAGGLYNEAGDEPTGRFAKTRAKAQNVRSKFAGAGSNKLLMGAGLAGSGFFILLIVLIIIGSSLKIPHFVENSIAYQFARVTRQMVVNSNNLTSEKLAIDAADDRTWTKIKNKYSSTTGKAKDLHEKLANKYSPGKIASNYGEAEHFKPVYSQATLLRGPRLVGVTLDNETYRVNGPTGFNRFIPGVKTVSTVRTTKTLVPYLNESLKLDGYGPIMRSRILSQMRKELGINLVAWKVGQYAGMTPEEARLQQARDLKAAVDKDNVASAKTKELAKASEEAKSKLDEDVADDKKLRTILNNRGLDPEVVTTVEKTLNGGNGLLKGLAGFLSPAYSIGLPVCLIYDSSLQKNGPTIDAQSDQLRRTAQYVRTAAGQQKNGYDASPEAIGALNGQLGDVTTSNSEVRAQGGQINTSDYPSAQASPAGDYTVFDALFSGPAASAVNAIADGVCPTVTDPTTGFALGVGSLALCATGIGCLGKEAAEEGVKSFVGRLTGRIVTKIAGEQKGQTATAVVGAIRSGAKSSIKNGAITAGVVVGGTILARSVVYTHANQMHNGLQQDEDFTADVDNGNQLESSEVMRKDFYGKPFVDGEAAASDSADRQQVVAANQQNSLYERYASLANPSSFISKLAMMSTSITSRPFVTNIQNLTGSIIRPLTSIGSVYGVIGSQHAFAGSSARSTAARYGNVTWGFTKAELALMKNDASYSSSLANQKILDDSGVEDQIEEKFSPCYTKSMGALLADGDIVRDDDGDVVPDKGLCSPNNLGFNSPEGLASDSSPDSPNRQDLIFRWRVAHSYNNTLDDLVDRQEIDATGGSGPATPVEPTGAVSSDEKQVAQAILDNHNVSYQFSAQEDVKLAAQGKPGTNNKAIDIRGLQIVAALAKKHKVVVSAYKSHGQGHSAGSDHYSGNAVDIASIDGVVAYKNITDFYSEFKEYAKGAVFLQGSCPGAKAAPSGMNRLGGDTCDHQHISLR